MTKKISEIYATNPVTTVLASMQFLVNNSDTSEVCLASQIATYVMSTAEASDVSVDDASFKVIGADSVQVALNEIDTALLNARSTGLRYGGTISVNAGNSGQIDISSAYGQILDNSTPSNPLFYNVTYTGQTAITPTDDATTYYYVDNTGALGSGTAIPTREQRRTRMYIGRVVKSSGVVIGFASEAIPLQQDGVNIKDLSEVLGLMRVSGIYVSPASTDLTLSYTGGGLFGFGANIHENSLDPNVITIASEASLTFRVGTQTGTIQTDITDLPVGSYDNAGTVTAIAGSSNQAQIFTVYTFESGNIRIAYGQNVYSTLDDAITSLSSIDRDYITPPNYENGFKVGYIVATKGCTDLSDTATARFFTTNKFGGLL